MDEVANLAARPLCDFFGMMGAGQLRMHCLADGESVGYVVLGLIVLGMLALARQRSY